MAPKWPLLILQRQDVHHVPFQSQWSVKVLSVKWVEEVRRLAHSSVFGKFVSSPAKAKLDELRCASPTVVLTAERLDHTWQMTLTACILLKVSSQRQQLQSQGIVGHIDFILMTEGPEINLFTGFDPTSRSRANWGIIAVPKKLIFAVSGGAGGLKPAFIIK